MVQELAALAINLTWNGRNAELMAQKGGLQRLVDRVAEKKDPLLMKVGQGHGHQGRQAGCVVRQEQQRRSQGGLGWRVSVGPWMLLVRPLWSGIDVACLVG